MICSNCENDNPRSAIECLSCGVKINSIACSCGFHNSLIDQYCGSCGKQLLKSPSLSKLQKGFSSPAATMTFTEQELMTLVNLQQSLLQQDDRHNKVTQDDIDSMFQ